MVKINAKLTGVDVELQRLEREGRRQIESKISAVSCHEHGGKPRIISWDGLQPTIEDPCCDAFTERLRKIR